MSNKKKINLLVGMAYGGLEVVVGPNPLIFQAQTLT